MAATLSGDFVVAWTNLEPHDGDSTGIFAQRFRPDLIFSDGFEGTAVTFGHSVRTE